MKIVVNGTFDIVHVGHIGLLEYAKSHKDAYVYVLVDSDRRVQELKGKSRPINSEYERTTLLNSLKSVDRVDIFDNDLELEELIKNYNPDLMIKGSDYRDKPIIGSQYCKQIKFYERITKYSSTGKIKDIANR